MKHYVIRQKKDAGSHLGLLDAALFDKAYENWDEVQYGYFPWYANATGTVPHEKMPSGMVLVGESKKYYFGARSLARGLYAINAKFYLACLEAGVKFVDVEKVKFIVDGGAENPVSYYAAVFKSYPCDEVIESTSKMTCDEYGWIESFERLELRSTDSALFRIGGLSPYIDTLYCTEDFKEIAERHGVLGVEFISLDESDSRGVYPL
ncbi:hypothetical protein N5F23_19370 [Pseudomonas sichuanensis]|uniref:hypothetical protein n=1 Tax=Pseudomonas sichuanensis TaxID=2213015 RepID=UPI00244BE23F|nr:hypothetical protein [Pseudomonas sichuanensis]MDH0729910.1 hypothetical protein [Pseudomonas sichuanensis]MDH1584743.1 hypothetical protein [Pseudomonas sichuanensis]MDH1594002.1 hypothetical protein [Pseudomonas sichuanensis]MDH1600514.1 hypothetical protein [Pseudomonas sichuanensis]